MKIPNASALAVPDLIRRWTVLCESTAARLTSEAGA